MECLKDSTPMHRGPHLGLQGNELLLGSDEVPKDRDSASKDEGKEETET